MADAENMYQKGRNYFVTIQDARNASNSTPENAWGNGDKRDFQCWDIESK